MQTSSEGAVAAKWKWFGGSRELMSSFFIASTGELNTIPNL